jgi:hypothetical protein
MKYLGLVFLFFVSFSNVFSQNVEIDSLAINPKSVVAASNLNLLYREIENPIRIAVSGIENNKIFVSCEYGQVRKGLLENEYIYNYDSNKTLDYELETIFVSKVINKDTLLIGKHVFRMKNIPKPIIQLGSIDKNGKISIYIVRAANAVYSILSGFSFRGYMYEVKSFTIELIKKEGDTIIYTNNKGNTIESDFKMNLLKVKTGDKIILKDVYMKNSYNGIVSKSKDNLEVEVE